MTYFGFLLLFLVLPIVALLLFAALQRRPSTPAVWVAIAVQVVLAVLYTSPWDNYLVAHGVWYYNPVRVSGILLGFVPVEEYVFFVLQAILVGLVWQALSPRSGFVRAFVPSGRTRLWSCAVVGLLWLGALLLLFGGWKPGTYLSLISAWALPPILIQLAFGADILWHKRELLLGLIVLPGLYLSAADSLAIRSGIWTIDPAQSMGVFIGSLPLEEGLFFFVTVVLLSFGMALSLSSESHSRLAVYLDGLRTRLPWALRPHDVAGDQESTGS